MINSIMLQDGGSGLMQILMIVALFAIFYFLMIRPQSKKQKEIRKFREGLQNGDKVITAGGIYGRIKEIKENAVILEVADGVRIQVDKVSVYRSGADGAQPKKQ